LWQQQQQQQQQLTGKPEGCAAAVPVGTFNKVLEAELQSDS
jgi:hypothetical protein